VDDSTRAKLQKIIDREEILDCLTRYTRGMDRQDRDMVRSAFHEDAIDLHSRLACDVDGFLNWVFPYHAEQRFHQHYLSNHSVEIDGDVAHSEIYYKFISSYPEPSKRLFCAGGRYIDRMERRDGAWRIAVRICTAEWQTELEMTKAGAPIDTAMLIEDFTVTRSPQDVSYIRPLTGRLAAKPDL
jgi:hypothetical protein